MNFRYVKSRNDNQLRGAEVTEYADLNDCRPYASANDSTNAANFYLPCGLIARSVFNGNISIYCWLSSAHCNAVILRAFSSRSSISSF